MPGPVFLRGDHVDLHVIDEDDLRYLQELINDPRVWKSLFSAEPKTMADEREFYENFVSGGSGVHLLVCESGDPVGVIGISDIDPSWGIGELGLYIDPTAHGEGYGTAAAELLVDYAFDQRRLAKLSAEALATNDASRRVLKKAGFVEEGRLREQGFVDGERVDVLQFGLLADDR